MEDGKWTLAGDFGNAGVSLEGIESSEKNEQAKQLYNYAVRQSIQGNALKTDENGIAMIGGLEQGLYLIAQTKVWTDEKQGSYQASPYLISIPEEIDGSYIWDVVTKPKASGSRKRRSILKCRIKIRKRRRRKERKQEIQARRLCHCFY